MGVSFLPPKLLYDFLLSLLNDSAQRYASFIVWQDEENGIFKIVNPKGLSTLWGIKKQHPNMTYDKLSRALRHYYKTKKLRKVPEGRHCYQFIYSQLVRHVKEDDLSEHTHFLANHTF